MMDFIVDSQKRKARACPVCGQKFRPAPQHAWTITRRTMPELVCSYSCMRAWERQRGRIRKETAK